MKKTMNRRNFLKNSATTGAACCLMLGGANSFASTMFQDGEKPDPKKLNYCGYTCPKDCKWLIGSNNNDVALKQEGYKAWKVKERFDLEFDPDNMFCFGCKNEDQPEGFLLKRCTARSCAIEKGYDCCIECDELTSCQWRGAGPEVAK